MSRIGIILLGSNIDPEKNMEEAIELLISRFDVLAISSIYESKPIKKREAPNYLNAAVMINTSLDPVQIKYDHCRLIETALNRVRTHDKFKPRTIDLDLVLLGEMIYNNEEYDITLPDPEIMQYAHIALPLTEIAPELMHPVYGLPLRSIAQRFNNGHSVRIYKRITDIKQFVKS